MNFFLYAAAMVLQSLDMDHVIMNLQQTLPNAIDFSQGILSLFPTRWRLSGSTVQNLDFNHISISSGLLFN